jgi:LacI family transcriptional regulator
LEYNKHPLVQTLHKGKGKTVGMIVGDIRNPFYSHLIWYTEQVLHRNGFQTIICTSNYDINKIIDFLDTALVNNYSGIITVSIQNSEMITHKLNNMDCPVVLLNRYLPHFNGDVVVTDNFAGAYAATKYLIENGHTKIGFLKGPDNSTLTEDRYSGFTKALSNFNIDVDEKYIKQGSLDLESGYVFGEYLVSHQENMPTAVIAGNDLMAIGIIDSLTKNNILVPKEVSVIGFDDIPFASINTVSLTTVQQPIKEMSETAAKIIVERAKNPELHERQKVLFEPKLIIRNSTRAM